MRIQLARRANIEKCINKIEKPDFPCTNPSKSQLNHNGARVCNYKSRTGNKNTSTLFSTFIALPRLLLCERNGNDSIRNRFGAVGFNSITLTSFPLLNSKCKRRAEKNIHATSVYIHLILNESFPSVFFCYVFLYVDFICYIFPLLRAGFNRNCERDVLSLARRGLKIHLLYELMLTSLDLIDSIIANAAMRDRKSNFLIALLLSAKKFFRCRNRHKQGLCTKYS